MAITNDQLTSLQNEHTELKESFRRQLIKLEEAVRDKYILSEYLQQLQISAAQDRYLQELAVNSDRLLRRYDQHTEVMERKVVGSPRPTKSWKPSFNSTSWPPKQKWPLYVSSTKWVKHKWRLRWSNTERSWTQRSKQHSLKDGTNGRLKQPNYKSFNTNTFWGHLCVYFILIFTFNSIIYKS